MLKAMVEEMNRYGESPTEVVKMLNVKPEYAGDVKYDVEVIFNKQKVKKCHPEVWKGNPLSDEVRLGFHIDSPDKKDGEKHDRVLEAVCVGEDDVDCGWIDKQFTTAHLYQVLPQEGKYMYRDEKGNHLTLTKKVEHYYDWRAL
jgi:hypothetical protein